MRAISVRLTLSTIVAIVLYCGISIQAQERQRTVRSPDQPSSSSGLLPPEDIVRVRTRAVFIDALVKDRKTNEPVRNLAREDFQVLDDGSPRRLSYFTREG